ncbi:tRNA (adenosine(37)-N6)-threonylcarbamoyltransferase complex ATPase subunit type 1 TsaE [Candidatus Parcubacteria bacterium]|nr:tRNA (adenosine(37)-N6)-threonylcarbamoyltransferase complex ATPase subunit type 1 TsaE [Candidatus Parcubacteria bacterium]
MEILTENFKQTKKAGSILAKEITRTSAEMAVIIGLEGDLGAGKTTFLQGFGAGLGIKEKILSPTFAVFKKYSLSGSYQSFYHFDCYRIQEPKELLTLGFKEIISDPKNIVAIEWAEKARQLLPKEIIILKFDFIDETTRKIEAF